MNTTNATSPPPPLLPLPLCSAPADAAATPATFSTIKQINAGDLNVGYVDEGPANGPVVILLHGWPYDINSFVDVVPKLTGRATA
jgi:hypothetical protein